MGLLPNYMVPQTLLLTLVGPWATFWSKTATGFAAFCFPLVQCPHWRAAALRALQKMPMVFLLNSTHLPLQCGTQVRCCMWQMAGEVVWAVETTVFAAYSSPPLRFLHWQGMAQQEVWTAWAPLPPLTNLVESPLTLASPRSTLQKIMVIVFALSPSLRRSFKP